MAEQVDGQQVGKQRGGMTRRQVQKVTLTYDDGEVVEFDVLASHHTYVNHDAARDAEGKRRKIRMKWVRHDVSWLSDHEPIVT